MAISDLNVLEPKGRFVTGKNTSPEDWDVVSSSSESTGNKKQKQQLRKEPLTRTQKGSIGIWDSEIFLFKHTVSKVYTALLHCLPSNY